jgi:hypothetical protein
VRYPNDCGSQVNYINDKPEVEEAGSEMIMGLAVNKVDKKQIVANPAIYV